MSSCMQALWDLCLTDEEIQKELDKRKKNDCSNSERSNKDNGSDKESSSQDHSKDHKLVC